jgi:hypothetical protein
MARKAFSDLLGASLQAEEQAMSDRFAKADAYFAAHEQPAPKTSTREKVIRDGFSMPAHDYALIADLQAKSLQAGYAITKSEVLRAGLHALSRLSPSERHTIVTGLEKIKPGRAGKK